MLNFVFQCFAKSVFREQDEDIFPSPARCAQAVTGSGAQDRNAVGDTGVGKSLQEEALSARECVFEKGTHMPYSPAGGSTLTSSKSVAFAAYGSFPLKGEGDETLACSNSALLIPPETVAQARDPAMAERDAEDDLIEKTVVELRKFLHGMRRWAEISKGEPKDSAFSKDFVRFKTELEKLEPLVTVRSIFEKARKTSTETPSKTFAGTDVSKGLFFSKIELAYLEAALAEVFDYLYKSKPLIGRLKKQEKSIAMAFSEVRALSLSSVASVGVAPFTVGGPCFQRDSAAISKVAKAPGYYNFPSWLSFEGRCGEASFSSVPLLLWGELLAAVDSGWDTHEKLTPFFSGAIYVRQEFHVSQSQLA
ncbi:hypothetical protein [Ottowia sp. VDI28]|uniref:hypothetical protein n=1 Tax=Ottowia sp. VDI28 TaxID=3133968 RepID=UPI003C2EFDE4